MWGQCSCHTGPCQAKHRGMAEKEEKKKNGQKADVGIRTVALKRADGENLCRVLRSHAESECSCTLYVFNAEIVVPSKTHLIHFYK